MRTLKLLLLSLLLLPAGLWAQNACIPDQALTSRQGFSNLSAVVPQATITVSPGPIYNSPTSTTPISGNVVTADSYGNYNICAAPSSGPQTVTVSGANMNTLTYYWTPGQILNAAGTWTAQQTFTAPVSFTNSVSFTGQTTFNTNVVFTTIVASELEAAVGSLLTLAGPGGALPNIELSGNAFPNGLIIASTTGIAINGQFNVYNNLLTTGNGVESIQASSGPVAIGSGTSIAATSLCALSACPAGTYLVHVYVEVTNACTTTGGYVIWLGYTDDAGTKSGSATTTFVPLNGLGVTQSTGSLALASTSNYGQGTFVLRTTGAVTGGLGTINYGTTATACGSGGPAAGTMRLDVGRLE
jgi:hypothetical protein